jgi:hypothetical protein
LTNRYQPISTNSLRRSITVCVLATLLVCMVTGPLFAQSRQSQDETWNAKILAEQLARASKDDGLSALVDLSAEALKRRLDESPSQPAGNESINTVVSRGATSPTPPQGHGSEGRFSLTPYVWLAGLQGDVGSGGRVIHVDAPFSEVIDQVNFGFAAVFEARLAGKWLLLADFNYINLADDKPAPGPLFDSAELSIKSFFSSIEAGYNIAHRPSVSFDLTGGVRVFHQSMNLELRRGSTRLNADQSATWVDPIVGFHIHAGDKVFVALKGDIGGFGAASTFTWHVFGGIGLNLGKHLALVAGYRYLDVDYRSADFIYDTAMSGLLLGFAFRF